MDPNVPPPPAGTTSTREAPGDRFVHAVVTVVAAGVADRYQVGITTACRELTIQAPAANVGTIFIGDSGVTNSAGAKVGLGLTAGTSFGPVSLRRASDIWIAGSNAADRAVIVGVQ